MDRAVNKHQHKIDIVAVSVKLTQFRPVSNTEFSCSVWRQFQYCVETSSGKKLSNQLCMASRRLRRLVSTWIECSSSDIVARSVKLKPVRLVSNTGTSHSVKGSAQHCAETSSGVSSRINSAWHQEVSTARKTLQMCMGVE